ncbi:MAG TPA: hypothetical protein PKE29_06450 [Phycisphaerales bacterium]|nr:hypothetical protein [Phycisphaerales bacterium]
MTERDFASMAGLMLAAILGGYIALLLVRGALGRVLGISPNVLRGMTGQSPGHESALSAGARAMRVFRWVLPLSGLFAGFIAWYVTADRGLFSGSTIRDGFFPGIAGVSMFGLLFVVVTALALTCVVERSLKTVKSDALLPWLVCRHCLYPLAGLPRQASEVRCPECGTTVGVLVFPERRGTVGAMMGCFRAVRTHPIGVLCARILALVGVAVMVLAVLLTPGSVSELREAGVQLSVMLRDWVLFQDSRVSWAGPSANGDAFVLLRDETPYLIGTNSGEIAFLSRAEGSPAFTGAARLGRPARMRHVFASITRFDGRSRECVGEWSDGDSRGDSRRTATLGDIGGGPLRTNFGTLQPGVACYRVFVRPGWLEVRALDEANPTDCTAILRLRVLTAKEGDGATQERGFDK